jgi:signal transduction histidine kinase
MNLNSRSRPVKWGIVLGMTLLYAVAFQPIMEEIGRAGASLIIIPVALTGFYFGTTAGLIAGFLSIAMNTVLLAGFDDSNWPTTIFNYWPAILLAFAAGYIAGQLRDVSMERERTLNNLRSHEHYLTLLNKMTHTIIASNDFEAPLKKLVRDMANLLEADDCYITRWDAVRKQVIPIASSAQLARPYSEMYFSPGSANLTESVLMAGHVMLVEDDLKSPYADLEVARQTPACSLLGIPLIVGEHKLGAALVAFNTPHRFTPQEIERAQQTGDQIALVLWDLQQDIELQQRLRESTALVNIAQALSETERVGLSTVLQLIAKSAQELIPAAEQAVIHLLDQEQQILTAHAVIGFDDDANRNQKIRPSEGVAGHVIVSGETINIADVGTDPRFLVSGPMPSFRSLMVAPVQSGERKLGTISVQSGLVSAFTEAESQLLSALGTQAAIAIENAHLLESTQQALKETNALYRINQGLVVSLDPQELLQDVVELLQKNFSYHHVQIYVIETDSGDFALRASSGEIGKQLIEKKHRLHAGEGIVGYTAETGAPFFTNDVDKVFFFVRNPLLSDTKSELAVPVKIDGRILGVLDIQQVPPRILVQRDIQLVSAVADQLAIALQKANLYTDLQTSLQMEKAIRSQMVQSERLAVMGRLLASVSHELNNPLQAIQNALFLLREEKDISDQGRQDLDIVLSESERMSALLNRLRSTYRSAQIEDFQPTQINSIIEDVYALIGTHLRHNEISFEFHPDPDLPEIPALTDQIRQVMLNLLMNAVEAMPTGGRLTVSTQCLKESGKVLIKVSDTGKGIDPAILPNIFDAFVTDKERGTGLGLTITYDIVTKHHGRIQAENNPLGGATFNVWLPCVQGNEE